MLRFFFRELGFWFFIVLVMRLEGDSYNFFSNNKIHRICTFFMFLVVNSDKKGEKPDATPDARKHYCCARHKKTVVVGHGK